MQNKLKQIMPTREKKVATNRNYFLRKMRLKFANTNFRILCKIAIWNRQKRLEKKQIIWSRLAVLEK